MIFGTEYFCFLNNFRKSKSSQFQESRNNLATVSIQKKNLQIDSFCRFRPNVIN